MDKEELRMEAGRFYRTASGEVIGPMAWFSPNETLYSMTDTACFVRLWRPDGRRYNVDASDGNAVCEVGFSPISPEPSLRLDSVLHVGDAAATKLRALENANKELLRRALAAEQALGLATARFRQTLADERSRIAARIRAVFEVNFPA